MCKPVPTATDLPAAVRIALYQQCALLGRDQYTGNCLDHLPDELQRELGVGADVGSVFEHVSKLIANPPSEGPLRDLAQRVRLILGLV
jgi:hypothetical protein